MCQHTYNLVSTILGGLTLVAAVATLFYLRRYTIASREQVEATRATANAAAETAKIAADQVEATYRPCLVIATGTLQREMSPTKRDDDIDTATVEIPSRGVIIRNIGNGPAVGIHVRVLTETNDEAHPLIYVRRAYARV